jgi:para-nitrobenzyl esterase
MTRNDAPETPIADGTNIEVGTVAGRVRGRVVDGVARFLGVPFAAPPVGPLRFAVPAPPRSWQGVRDATARGPNAPQPTRAIPGVDLSPLNGRGWRRGEDYLTVDVWTSEPGRAGLPVMVWLHGGAFVVGEPGSPAFDGTALARSGVVLVSVTYRLGVEGFLTFEGGATNVALRDQLAALAWVRDNIAAFGGDPDRVTVFGESAGAMSIGCLLGSPLARGLFCRAIVQSGGAEMLHSVAVGARFTAMLAAELGVAPTADAFRPLTFDATLAAQQALGDPRRRVDLREADGVDPGYGLVRFAPVFGDDVLPEHPLRAVAACSAADVDLLVGSNSEEANLYFVPTGVVDTLSAEQLRGMLGAVHPRPEELLDGGAPDESPGLALARVISDAVFQGPARRLGEAHAGTGTGRTFAYDFRWRSPACGGRLGACHGLELPFVFGTLAAATGPDAILGEAPPQGVSDQMRTAWVAFARDGDPGWAAAPEVHGFG